MALEFASNIAGVSYPFTTARSRQPSLSRSSPTAPQAQSELRTPRASVESVKVPPPVIVYDRLPVQPTWGRSCRQPGPSGSAKIELTNQSRRPSPSRSSTTEPIAFSSVPAPSASVTSSNPRP